MAYNLPNAWDPGYALPKNVEDEGLERRAFVTKQAPRGTYDEAELPAMRMAVPRYVQDEGYGQGTFTTAWQPSGSYNGPKVPSWLNKRPQVVKEKRLPNGGRVVTVQPLSDTEPLPAPFEEYGSQAAQMLLQKVSALPMGQRERALRTILDKVDPSLWKRTREIWDRYRSQGMNPTQALPLALSRAMATGIAAEVIDVGLRRSAPQVVSLLGLGCYGRRAVLGAMGDDAMQPAPVPAPTCAPPAGYTWVPGATPGTGSWARLRAGQTPVPGPCAADGKPTTADTNVHESVVVLRRDPTAINAGGFVFTDLKDRIWGKGGVTFRSEPDLLITSADALTQSQAQFIKGFLTTEGGARRSYTTDGAEGFRDADDVAWMAKIGVTPDDQLRLYSMRAFRYAIFPFAKTINMATGKELQLHVMLNKANVDQPWDAGKNPTVMKVWLSRSPEGDSLWNSIKEGVLSIPSGIQAVTEATGLDSVTGAVGNAVLDGLEKLGDLACKVLSTEAGQTAAGAAAVVVGAPPQAGVAGAKIAANQCGKPPPPPPVVLPASSMLPVVLMAGGAVLAVVLLTGKKKKRKS